jgi:hypothetical protein
VDERERRIGMNEAVFREINERIREVGETFSVVDELLDLVCECGLADCTERIQMAAADYERIRANPTYFAIVPGHEIPEVETVVERHKGYVIVRKTVGEAAELAKETDPRD